MIINSKATQPVIPLLTNGGTITYAQCKRCGAGQGFKCVTPRGIVTDTHKGRTTVFVPDACEHPAESRVRFVYGAPGYGGGVWCEKCHETIEDNGGILTLADVK